MIRLARSAPAVLVGAALAACAPLSPPAAPDTAVPTLRREIRACMEPNHPPLSRRDGSGFENVLAGWIAEELGATLVPVWHEQWRGFAGRTVGAGRCDFWPGVPAGWERLLTTRPYYRSSYVFVTRADAAPVSGFDDPRLRRERVGVPRIANDVSATPAGHLLTRGRGYMPNVVGYAPHGPAPPAQQAIAALDRRDIDIAILWGPEAGWHAARASTPLRVQSARAPSDAREVALEFDIAVGVARDDRTLRNDIDAALARLRPRIDALLDEFRVPRAAAF